MQEILTLIGFVLEKGGPTQIDQMKTFLYAMKVIIEKQDEMELGWTKEEREMLFSVVNGHHNLRVLAVRKRRERTGEGLRECVESAHALHEKYGKKW